jgi:acetyl-CoA carboxylase biotin carboxyl carrier protein
MGKETIDSTDAFDLRILRQIVKLMNENDLAEVDLRNATQRIRLRKQGGELTPVLSAAPAISPHGPAAPPVPAEPKAAAAESTAHLVEITSPMLGTFYRASSPDAEPFVQIGTHVESETIVCIIEAMKVFNEIAAEKRGKIVAVLVENGHPVEYGQPLFRIDPTG